MLSWAELVALLSAIAGNAAALVAGIFGIILTAVGAFGISTSAKWAFIATGLAAIFVSPVLAWRDEYRQGAQNRADIQELKTQLDELAQPKFEVGISQALSIYDTESNQTQVILSLSVINSGAPSAALGWSAHYTSPTLDSDVRFVQPIEPVVFRAKNEAGIKFDASQNIVSKIDVIQRGGILPGRTLIVFSGNHVDELSAGRGSITISVHDYKQKLYHAVFIGRGSEHLRFQPGDVVVPNAPNPHGKR